MAASLDGSLIFGDSVQMVTADNPRRNQQNTYPGLDGIEELDQGTNGRFTFVTGRLVAQSPAGVGAICDLWMSFDDGRTHVLVDNESRIWPYVKLESFEPERGGRYAPPYGYTRRYAARFRHLL